MTQERLVTLESAKKLKLLGFNELCNNCNKSLNESVITFDLKGFHNYCFFCFMYRIIAAGQPTNPNNPNNRKGSPNHPNRLVNRIVF